MPRVSSRADTTRALPYSVIKPESSLKVKDPEKPERKVKSAPYTYDKVLFLTLVLKQARPNWDMIASAMNAKTKAKTYDTWRQIVHPALTTGRAWSTASGSAWSNAEKIKLVMMVIESLKIDWQIIGEAFPGRTKTQLYDVWRQGIIPRIKKGEPIV